MIYNRFATALSCQTVFLAIAPVLLLSLPLPAAQREFDVVVYGGTAGGAIAAIAAANEGCTVALLEPLGRIGVAISTEPGDDVGNQDVIGGLAREFFERAGKHSKEPAALKFEPQAADSVFRDWLKEAGVAVFFEQRVNRVRKEGLRIVNLTAQNGETFAARVFIDASSEGDLLAGAGISSEKTASEARLMIGDYVITEADLVTSRTKPDSIGLGLDRSESRPAQPFEIAYRSLTPKRSECDNLLVTGCLSADRSAFPSLCSGSTRMVLGHGAGVAAAWAVHYRAPVQEVNCTLLRKKLRLQKQIVSIPGQERDRAAALGLPGSVVDNAAAQLRGLWTSSTSVKPFVGHDYVHDGNTDKGAKTARFTPFLPAEGVYEVRISCVPGGNRATNVPVVVNAADGVRKLSVNQKKSPKERPFTPLGKFQFKAGADGYVEIGTAGTDGHVVADAVQWLPVKP